MLIELKVKNFLSIKEEVVFSMERSNVDKDTLINNFVNINNKLKILKSSVIFGPNASGKSNLLKTIHFLKYLVLNSGDFKKKHKIKYLPFKLDSNYRENKPISINLKFLKDKDIYSYEVLISKIKDKDMDYNFIINSEILKKNSDIIYKRTKTKVNSNNEILNGTLREFQTNKNSLFLSKSQVLGFENLNKVYSWFDENLSIDLNSDKSFGLNFTRDKLKTDKKFKKFVLDYLKKADFGNICDIEIKEREIKLPEDVSKEIKEIIEKNERFKIKTFHLDDKSNKIEFDFDIEESHGNKKYLSLLGPIYDMIEKDKIFIVDELDKNLHPEILRLIFEIIHNSNSKAQIISTSHAFPLLMYVNNSEDEIFRRDQIWFTRKREDQSTQIYSLINVGGIRRDLRIFKAYFDGKLEALPNIKHK